MTVSKLQLDGDRIAIEATVAISLVETIFLDLGCAASTATAVAEHLADANMCGVESHGIMRVLQYAEQFRGGTLNPLGQPKFVQHTSGLYAIDGDGGIGIPAMQLAVKEGCQIAAMQGISAIAIRNVGHTGRLGVFAETAAYDGFLTIIIGGGNRKKWPQVAPYGGRRGILPTNPYCIGIPGGESGPVVIDLATAKIAGGWIYAAKSAGALLPEDCLMDVEGNPTTDPNDYFAGGAILPAGGPKGYALALMAELIGEAMLGPATTECNWLMITVNTSGYRDQGAMRQAAEEILQEIRQCPPAAGVERVEIPGERERECRKIANGYIDLPRRTWQQIQLLAESAKS